MMKKIFLKKTLVFVTTFALLTTMLSSISFDVVAEEPPINEDGCFVQGTGTYFEIINSSYLNITLTSSENIHIYLESIPKMINYYIESNSSANSTLITLSNLEGNKVYYLYQDGNLIGQITTDENGTYSYTSDLTTSHQIYIQENISTIIIKSDGTINPSTAPISKSGNTYTLTGNIYDSIKIQKSTIIIDGAGYLIQGSGSGNGIEILSQNYVTIQNIHIKGFSYGIYFYSTSFNTVKECNISNNIYGIWMNFPTRNTIMDNSISNNQYAIWLNSAYYNTISNNMFSNSPYSVYFNSGYYSYNNLVSKNIFSYNINAIYFIGNDNWYAIITNNSFSHNYRGITNIDDHYTSVNFNTFSVNTIGVYLRNSQGDRFHHNNFINNVYQFYRYDTYSWAYWDDGYGIGNYWSDYTGLDDGSNGRIANDGVGDTLIPHPYTNKGNGYYRLDNYPLMNPWGLNDPPVANANGPYTGYEGSVIILDASASTDPNDDSLQYHWDFNNDGTWDTSYSTNPTASYTWYDDHNGIIAVEVYDGEKTDTATSTVTINNVAPTVEAGIDQSVNEGELVTIAPAFIDLGTGDTHIASIDWQDESPTNIDPAYSPLSDSHTYNDNGIFTVTVTVTDDDLGVGADTLTITVNDLGPTAVAGNDQTIDESQTINVDGSGSFSNPDNIVLYEWDWTSDGIYENTGVAATSPQYMDNGIYTITLRVTDDDGSTDTDILIVTVNDLAPAASFTWSPQSQNEGSSVQFTDSSTSYPDNIVSWNWDFASLGSSTDKNPLFTFQDNGIFVVTLTVTDDDGSTNSVSHGITVFNVAPTIDTLNAPIDPIQIGSSILLTSSFTDPGALDVHTAVIDWNDGTTSTVNIPVGDRLLSQYHTYNSAGVYTLTLTLNDDDGGYYVKLFQYVVIYDPSAGFVTGGGWIISPEGSYTPNPTLTGKANFGFVSKYINGAPSGNTEFQFKVGNMNFHSEYYQWLVIAGAKAMYKGTGTINGQGYYGFMLSAIDEELTPSTDVDLFRIQIWDKNNNDQIIYDNQIGDDDDSDPTTAISGGNIKIHAT